MSKLKSLTLRGYKSIEALEGFELGPNLNVLIGANGAGKSNFISMFRLLSELAAGRLAATLPFPTDPRSGFAKWPA